MLASPGRGRYLLLLAGLLLLLSGVVAPAFAVDFSAYWLYREDGGDNLDTISTFQQRYSLSVGPGLTFQPTPAIAASFNVGYTRDERDLGEGMTTVEQITPSAQLSLTNDIFIASLSGQITEFRPDDGRNFTTESWDATLASNWVEDFWPQLSVNYSERTETSANLGNALGAETEQRTFATSASWDLKAFRLFYDYTQGRQEDLANDGLTDTQTHLARFETSQSFWDRRISFNLSQQYQQSEADFQLTAPGGFFENPLLSQARSRVSAPAVVPLPGDVGFDADLDGGPPPQVTVTNGQRLYLAVTLGALEQVGRIYLYLDPLVSGSQAAALPWRLYTSNAIIIDDWVETGATPAVIFNAARQRLEVAVELIGSEFMVSADVSGLARDLVITRVEAVTLINVDTVSRQASHLTNASLRIQFTPTLSATTSLVYERNDNENETDAGTQSSDTTNRTVAANVRWQPSTYVMPSVSFSESRQEFSGSGITSEEINRAYSLIVATYPLPTLNVTFGATRTDFFTNGRKTSTSDNFSVTSTAQIYPDLTASWNVNVINREQGQVEEGFSSTSDILSSRLTLNARLAPTLTADLTLNYRDLDTETESLVADPVTGVLSPRVTTSSSTGFDSTLGLVYRPSELLSMRLLSTNFWSGTDAEDTLAFAMDLALLRTRNTRLTFTYLFSQAELTSHSYNLNGSWDISQALSLQTLLNYRTAEFATWSTLVQMSLRL